MDHNSDTPALSALPDQPLAGERVAFTGTLASMTHQAAQTLVEQHGGSATTHVSRQTTILVVGEEGWPLEDDGTPSVKLQQAVRLQDEGLALRIVTESEWLGWLGLSESGEVRREYTPAMLSQLLSIPVGTLRAWHRMGLIRPVRQVYRLPYFDFREVSNVRRLADLIEAGVSPRQIQSSLLGMQSVLGPGDRSLDQLEILAGGARLVLRDDEGLREPASGQRVFDFEPPAPEAAEEDADVASTRNVQAHWTASEWRQEACRHVEAGELEAAVEAFRLSLMDQPLQPEVHFQLAETLYRMNDVPAALERYHVAVELDHNYLEAWTQLGCVYAESNRLESAVEAFRIALDLHADYPDAHLHMAEALHQLGRTAEAVPHWQQYLQFDHRGPWADNARQRLAEAGAD
ncbi:MAG TPA: tetratricopeptide repeat protein [Planctomycetaceae bacterium]|nr:tetratricopeptide repeat protein [Planctomycetaceae bacterium]